MTRFYEFVHSPYHNKHREVQALVGYLNKIYPQFTEKKCDRKKVFKKLFPNKKHNQADLALLFTYTYRLGNQFLSVEQYQKQTIAQEMNLLSALSRKGQPAIFRKRFQKTQQQLTQNPFRPSLFYQQQFELIQNNPLHSWKELSLDLSEKQYYLDYFYLADRLKFACTLLLRSKVMGIQFDVQFMDKLLKMIQSDWERYQEIPPLTVYYHLYRLILEEDAARFYEALPIIEANTAFFPKNELQDIYTYVQNFCIKQINANNTVFQRELFHIYKIQLTQGLLLSEKGQLSEWHYKNIATLGLRLKEIDWVHQFLETYKTEIPIGSRDNAYRYNRAAYAYEVGDYDEVLELLVQVEYTDIQYGLGARWLLLRTYYELGESTSFLALCDSFRLYLQRNQLISEFKKKGNEQGIRLAKRAFQLKLDLPYIKKAKAIREVSKLNGELLTIETVFNREWLNSKIGALDKEIK